MLKIKGIVLDLFHTLVDVGKAPGASGRYTADVLGIDRTRWQRACFGHHHEICRPTRHRDVIAAIAHSLDPGISDELIDEATRERQRRFDHALINVDPAVLKALAGLRGAGYRLALLSNASSGEVSSWPNSPLAPLFDIALFSCESGTCKPAPDFYWRALRDLGANPEEVVFVGDGNSDEHRGAARVGLHTVLTTYFTAGTLDAAALEQRGRFARWRIDHPAQLAERIVQIEREGKRPAPFSGL